MGELIVLTERFRDRSPPRSGQRPGFFFDLACPFSYLAAERIERILGEVEWIPVDTDAVAAGGGRPRAPAAWTIRRQAARRAVELRLPLMWPERFPAAVPGALRAAAHAAERGAGGRFALAASRLAFCGGYDLEDPEILEAAAAAAGIAPEPCLAAAADDRRDEVLHATAGGLRVRGVRGLPVIQLGDRFLNAEAALAAHALAPPA